MPVLPAADISTSTTVVLFHSMVPSLSGKSVGMVKVLTRTRSMIGEDLTRPRIGSPCSRGACPRASVRIQTLDSQGPNRPSPPATEFAMRAKDPAADRARGDQNLRARHGRQALAPKDCWGGWDLRHQRIAAN